MLHNSPSALELTPSIVRVCSSVLFSPGPPIVFCVAVKKCALPPQPLVDHRPAKKWNGSRKRMNAWYLVGMNACYLVGILILCKGCWQHILDLYIFYAAKVSSNQVMVTKMIWINWIYFLLYCNKH